MNGLKAILFSLAAVVIIALFTANGQAAPTFAPTLHRERLSINTGGVTSATATTSAVIAGQIMRVDIDFDAGLTTTTDLTLYGTNDRIQTKAISLTNTATDAVLYPMVGQTDNTGTAVTYDGTYPVVAPYIVADQLTLAITQTTAATPAVVVDIYWKE